jgi:hypothetical protein
MESPSFEQQKIDEQKEFNKRMEWFEQQEIDRQKELDKRVEWVLGFGSVDQLLDQRDKEACYSSETTEALVRVKAFLHYELYEMLCLADSFGFRGIGELQYRNDRFLLQMYHDIISERIKKLDYIERAKAFNPENKN